MLNVLRVDKVINTSDSSLFIIGRRSVLIGSVDKTSQVEDLPTPCRDTSTSAFWRPFISMSWSLTNFRCSISISSMRPGVAFRQFPRSAHRTHSLQMPSPHRRLWFDSSVPVEVCFDTKALQNSCHRWGRQSRSIPWFHHIASSLEEGTLVGIHFLVILLRVSGESTMNDNEVAGE